MANIYIKPQMTIYELGEILFNYIKERWEDVLNRNIRELEQLFPEYEDATYGLYLDKLIPPVWKVINENGYRSAEKTKQADFIIGECLNFRNSLEKAKWGTPHHEKRVFWIVIENQYKDVIGTLLFELSHSHIKFNLPSPPRILPLEEIKQEEIINKILLLQEKFS
ncbi:DUF6022 family protein [Cytobacillus firmus]|uniref:DUF6022 family protein n=1 Tax=Cytobacillus firmus TaxID=1399 RepID=UPI002493EED9|nr:DUF6022 family protein [Cytobacillus firmus]